MKNKLFKKSMSVFLSVLMIMSCWVFMPGEHNHASAAVETTRGVPAINGKAYTNGSTAAYETPIFDGDLDRWFKFHNQGVDYVKISYPSHIYLDKSETLQSAGYFFNVDWHFGHHTDYRILIGANALGDNSQWTVAPDFPNAYTMTNIFTDYGFDASLPNGAPLGQYGASGTSDTAFDLRIVGYGHSSHGNDGFNYRNMRHNKYVLFRSNSSNEPNTATIYLMGTPGESYIGKTSLYSTSGYGFDAYGLQQNWSNGWKENSNTMFHQKGYGQSDNVSSSYKKDGWPEMEWNITIYNKEPLSNARGKADNIFNLNSANGALIKEGLEEFDNRYGYTKTGSSLTILKKRETNQTEINNETTALENAIKGMKAYADNAALKAAVANAEAILKETDYAKKYTQASRTALENAINSAKNSGYYPNVPVYSVTDLSDSSKWDFTSAAVADQGKINVLTSALNAVRMELQGYTVTWKNDNGTTLETDTDVKYGTTPTYNGETPTKAADNYKYTFSGWTPSVSAVTGDATYTATYDATPNSFIVTWEFADGTTKQETYAYGATPNAPANTVADYDATNHYEYTWPTITDVTGETTYQEIKTPTAHSYSESVTTAPTCTTAGVKTFTCTCGYSYTEAIDKADHTPGTAATCTTAQTCTVCGTVLAAELGHKEETIPAVPATCTATGLTEGKKCSVCGVVTVPQTETPTIAHKEEIIPAVESSCTETGLTEGKKCSVCGEILVAQQTTDKKAHSMGTWTQIKAPTCISEGQEQSKCTNCEYIGVKSVPATGEHVYGEWKYDPGSSDHTGKCIADSNCSATVKEAHSFTEDMQYKSNNLHDYKCSVCQARGASFNGTPREGLGESCTVDHYKVINDNHSYHYNVCACGNEMYTPHNVKNVGESKEPTCTEKGYQDKECTECGYTFRQEIAARGHDYATTFTVDKKASCTEDGSKSRHCSRCDSTTEVTVILARAHELVDTTEEKAATCIDTGIMNQKCSNEETAEYEACTYTTTRVIPAKGHIFGDVTEAKAATCIATGNEAYKQCETCSKFFAADAETNSTEAKDSADAFTTKIDETNHKNTTDHVEDPATCTDKGYTAGKFCEDCDKWISGHEEIPAINHKNKEYHKKVDATCVKEGTIEYWSCPACLKNFSDEACTTEVTELKIDINPNAHDLKTTPAKAPTCIDIGWDEYVTCKREGCTHTTYVEKAKLGHDWSDWETVTAATCLAEGSEKRSCEREDCDAQETHAITKLDHSYTGAIKSDGNGKEATHSFKCVNGCDNYGNATNHTWNDGVEAPEADCENAGTMTYTCTAEGCGATYTESVNPDGHTLGDWIAEVPATCVATGTKGHYECSVCHKYFADDRTTVIDDLTLDVDKNNHTNLVKTDKKDATCTTDGNIEYYTCEGCGKIYSDAAATTEITKAETVLKATDHNWDAWTFVADGQHKRVCANDKRHIETESCADSATDNDCDCDKCGELVAHTPADAVEENREEATCGKDGSYDSVVYCSVCNVKISSVKETISATGKHNYGAFAHVDGTSTHAKTCSVCSDTVTENCTAGDWVIDKTATCIEKGSQYKACTVCLHEMEREDIPMSDHNFGGEAVNKEDGKHHYACQNILDLEGTKCGAYGEEEACSGGEATCTAKAVCAKCDTEYGTVDADNHTNLVKTEAVANTCETDGNIEYWTCEDCSKIYSDEKAETEIKSEQTVIPAKGHAYEGVVTTQPTCTTKGEKTYTCKNDATHTYKEDVPALGHTDVADNNGYCDREGCNALICDHVGQETILKGDKKETCLEDGYTGDKHCAKCDVIVEYGEKIDKLGHKDENKDHTCDNGCDEYQGEHKDENTDHKCDYGCEVTFGKCEDSADDNDHVCDYGCGKVLEECVDNDKDHDCDNGCEAYFGEHKDENTDHKCDYGCEVAFGECKDSADDKDHVCDYGCGKVLEECTDGEDNNHNCDICGKEDVSDHVWVDATCETPKTCSVCGATDGEVKGHDYDTTKSESNLTRPVQNADGTWAQGYYTYTCKNDANHTIKEEVDRATYTAYETALENLNSLLETDITKEAKEAINAAIEANKVADNLITSEQPVIDEKTANLKEVFEKYNDSLNTYKVTFKIEGSEDVVVNVISGQDATAPTDVKKAYDDTYHYNFTGWDKEFTNVTSDLTVTAQFDATEHSFTTHTDKDDEYHTDKCDCGYSKDEKHTETSEVTTKASCYADGVRTYTCSVCSGTRTETIAKRAHNIVDTTVATAPTCSATGIMNQVCNHTGSDEYEACDYITTRVMDKVADAHKSEADYTVMQKATCEADGYKAILCEYCDVELSKEIIAALEHNMQETAAKVEPKCEVAGKTAVYTCANNCGKTEGGEEIAALEHDMQETAAKVEPKCEVPGKEAVYTCANNCGKTEGGEEIAALEHNMQKTADEVAPECEKPGKTAVYTCANGCGKTAGGEAIAALEHNMQETSAKVEPKCEVPGKTAVYTCANNCGKTEGGDEIAALKHDMQKTEDEIAPKCEVAGKTAVYTCANGCGKTEGGEVISALEHDMQETSAKVEPKCEVAGKEAVYTCANGCGKTEGGEEIEALSHDYESSVTKEATCKEEGTITYTCKNDASHTYTEVIQKPGHKASKAVIENNVEADCVNDGYYDSVVYCSVCGDELSRVKKDVLALGHTEVIDKAVEATCTKTGLTEGKHCSVCGEVFVKQMVVDAWGHTADEAVVENNDAADCLNGGKYESVVYCSVCGLELSRTVVETPAAGHMMIVVPIKYATCDKAGYSEHTECIVCGYTQNKTVYPAKGHVDNDSDGVCDECKYNKNYSAYCACLCHNDNWFMNLIYRIIRIIWKVFNIHKICACGAVHF